MLHANISSEPEIIDAIICARNVLEVQLDVTDQIRRQKFNIFNQQNGFHLMIVLRSLFLKMLQYNTGQDRMRYNNTQADVLYVKKSTKCKIW